MKTTRCSHLPWCAMLALAAAAAALPPPNAPAPAPIPTGAKISTLAVQVRSALSKAPLPNATVVVRALGSSDDGKTWAGHTDRNGCILFIGLPAGRYEARLEGSSMSLPARFSIESMNYTFVSLLAFPAID